MTDIESALLANTAATTALNTSIIQLLNAMITGGGAPVVVPNDSPVGASGVKEVKPGKPTAAKTAAPVDTPPTVEAAADPVPETKAEPSDEPAKVTKQDLKDLALQLIQADPAPKGAKVELKKLLQEFLPGVEKPNLDLLKEADYAPAKVAMVLKLRELEKASA